jgi:hypothetical protein
MLRCFACLRLCRPAQRHRQNRAPCVLRSACKTQVPRTQSWLLMSSDACSTATTFHTSKLNHFYSNAARGLFNSSLRCVCALCQVKRNPLCNRCFDCFEAQLKALFRCWVGSIFLLCTLCRSASCRDFQSMVFATNASLGRPLATRRFAPKFWQSFSCDERWRGLRWQPHRI